MSVTTKPHLEWDQRLAWKDISTVLRVGSEAHVEQGAGQIVSGRFVVGHPDDKDAPLVFRTYFPPGNVTPAHSHRVNYSEWILDGTREITRKWYRAGDIQVATAQTFYGPLIAGPAGVTVMAIFATQDYQPIAPQARTLERNTGDRKYFNKTSWDDLQSARIPAPNGTVTARYVVGLPDDPHSPVVSKSFYPPGTRIEAHTHDCSFAHIITDGSMTDGDEEYGPGEVRVATRGIVHGPLVAGPME